MKQKMIKEVIQLARQEIHGDKSIGSSMLFPLRLQVSSESFSGTGNLWDIEYSNHASDFGLDGSDSFI